MILCWCVCVCVCVCYYVCQVDAQSIKTFTRQFMTSLAKIKQKETTCMCCTLICRNIKAYPSSKKTTLPSKQHTLCYYTKKLFTKPAHTISKLHTQQIWIAKIDQITWPCTAIHTYIHTHIHYRIAKYVTFKKALDSPPHIARHPYTFTHKNA